MEQLNDDINSFNMEIDTTILKNKEFLKIILYDYRTSDAVAHFVSAYNNSKVSNLKEAVLEYDQSKNNRILLESQKLVLAKLDQVIENTQSINKTVKQRLRTYL